MCIQMCIKRGPNEDEDLLPLEPARVVGETVMLCTVPSHCSSIPAEMGVRGSLIRLRLSIQYSRRIICKLKNESVILNQIVYF